jgi:hypothetical protein
MMHKGKYVAVWIYDEAGRLFLGLQRNSEEHSRWAIIGKVVTEPDSIGVWLAIERLEERRPNEPIKVWTVKPEVCVIRWNFIITAQLLGEEIADTKTIGFQPDTE